MPIIEFFFHLPASLRNYIHYFLVKYDLSHCKFLSSCPYFPVGDLTSPRVKIGTNLKIFKLFANGEFKAQTQKTYNTDASMPIMIGANTENRNDEYFNGVIDEVAVWDIALSADDVFILHESGTNR